MKIINAKCITLIGVFYNAVNIVASSDGISMLLTDETPNNDNEQPKQQRMATLRGLAAKKNTNFQNVLAAIQQASTSTTNWTDVAAAASECKSHANETAIYLGLVIDAATQSDKAEVTSQTNQAAVSASAAKVAAFTARRLASGPTSDEESDGKDNAVISSLLKVDSGVGNFGTMITDAESAIATAKELEEAAANAVDAAMKADADQTSNEEQHRQNASSSEQDAREKVNKLAPLSMKLLRNITQLQRRIKFVLVAA